MSDLPGRQMIRTPNKVTRIIGGIEYIVDDSFSEAVGTALAVEDKVKIPAIVALLNDSSNREAVLSSKSQNLKFALLLLKSRLELPALPITANYPAELGPRTKSYMISFAGDEYKVTVLPFPQNQTEGSGQTSIANQVLKFDEFIADIQAFIGKKGSVEITNFLTEL